MNYIISGKNIEVTDALKQAIYEKLERIEKFFDEGTYDSCRTGER